MANSEPITRLSATDAKNRFSELLDAAEDHPVRIDRNGKTVAYVINAQDFDHIAGAASLARIERLLAAGSPSVAEPLRAYSAGTLSRQKAIDALMLKNYSHLLDALDLAKLPRPAIPPSAEKEMISSLQEVLRG